MKLNQKLIKQLRNGEIAAHNNGTLEQLREVLKAAFPEDIRPLAGDTKYYSRLYTNTYGWVGSQFLYEDKPTFKISDFYQPELFTGWAKDDKFPEWMFYFKDDMGEFGLNDGGEWMVKPGNRYSSDKDNRPATHEEIEQGLAEEAKRRGFKKGVKIKSPWLVAGDVSWECLAGDFKYDPESNELKDVSKNVSYTIYKNGQWAEIVEQPLQVKPKDKTNPIHYTVDGTTYSLNYQELKAEYDNVVAYSDEGFMSNLPQIAHLACIVSYLKGLGTQATIGDKGIIHELIHLMTDPDEPTNDLGEIREKFNKLIKLA